MGKWIKKLIILLLIFIAAVGVIMWTRRDSESARTYTTMKEASLPVMQLVYEGRVINELHGYTAEINAGSVRETIYPLSAERLVPVRIAHYGSKVTSVGYEVHSLDGEEFVERNKTEELTEDETGTLTAEIVLMDLLEGGKEYLLTFVLYNGEAEIAQYYTRVRTEAGTSVAGAVEFALEFSEKTFLEEPDEMIIAQLESNAAADNSSLGYTDIYSSYSHVLWGDLRPQKNGEMKISLFEFDRLMTSLSLSYDATAQNEEGDTEHYEVEEFYCVRLVNDKYYLMTYERLVNQKFPEGDIYTEDGDLQLGIVAADELPLQFVRNGNHTVFVQNGMLRSYDREGNRLKTLFAFADEAKGERSEYDQYGIRIIGAEENGDVDFLVYGYMNGGEHEGKTGVVYYRYLAEEDALEEVFYIASRQNYQRIKEELGTLSYMNESGLFYLMYEDTIYAIDIEGGEYVELASDVRPGALAVDESNGVVAWQESGEHGISDAITIYYLDSGERLNLNAPKGELMELKGFIDGDLLYGLVREKDREETHVYSSTDPIHALEIVNMDGEVERRYEQEGVYLTDIEILEDRICFGRQYLLNGIWQEMEDDVLFCKEGAAETVANLLETDYSERQKQTYVLDLGVTADVTVLSGMPKLLEKESVELVLGGLKASTGERYFAYSHGKLQGIFNTASEAIACIDADMGVVVDEYQRMVWNRGNRGNAAQIMMPAVEPVLEPEMADYMDLFLKKLGVDADCAAQLRAGKSVFDILQNYSDRKLVDLEGATLSQILYYLYEGVPVLGIDSNNQAMLFVGYYEAYGEVTLICYDLQSAEKKETELAETNERFFASGNRFISVIP